MDNPRLDRIAVLDFGGQYAHLIANRIRRLGVYSEIVACDTPAPELAVYKGIILSGGPGSVLDKGSPEFDRGLLDMRIPVLGLCYGHQLLARIMGGKVTKGENREYGKAVMYIKGQSPLFKGLGKNEQIWMSHGDAVSELPKGFQILASTDDCDIAAAGDIQRRIYGLQFHPEVTHTTHGMDILTNFLDICSCSRKWNSMAYLEEITGEIRRTCGDKKVFLLVSGGVDSTVAFALLNKALGPRRVLGLHIDNGLMRKGESAEILVYMKKHGFDNLKIEDASAEFLQALSGTFDPEKKRKIIGNMFLEAKERALAKLGLTSSEWILAQGTIYPDTIESAGTKHADRIKTHHNRIDSILELLAKGQVIEPLAQLYKDEVRVLGEKLGLPKSLVWRHPFPGPGLGVRVLCSEGFAEKIQADIDRKVKEIAGPAGYESVILPLRSVGVQGDGRTYAHPVLLTGKRDWNVLEELSTRITNGVHGVNRVIFGINVDHAVQYRLIKADITFSRLEKLREIDHAVTEQLIESGEYNTIWQMPVVLLPVVNEKDQECVVLRPVISQEAMTAQFAPLKDSTLDIIVKKARSINGLGDIFIDITHKPPGTIEWE